MSHSFRSGDIPPVTIETEITRVPRGHGSGELGDQQSSEGDN
jgi:hypothetical protein